LAQTSQRFLKAMV